MSEPIVPQRNSAEIKAAIEKHKESRPDHLQATRPDAPRSIRDRWEKWCVVKFQLETELGMALHWERNKWTDAAGKSITPVPWTGKSSISLNDKPRREDGNREERKTPEQYLEMLTAGLEELSKMDPLSPDFCPYRNRLSAIRTALINRMKQDGKVDAFEVPGIPRACDLQPKQSQHRREWDRERKRLGRAS